MARILVDSELRAFASKYIDPYNPALVNPASIDICLGDEWLLQDTDQRECGTLMLFPWRSVLGVTKEHFIFTKRYAADLKLKTTPARMGLNHSLAGWIDPGYEGKLTLTLFSTRRVLLEPGMRIAQVIIYELDTVPDVGYDQVGHYMHQQAPTPAVKLEEKDV